MPADRRHQPLDAALVALSGDFGQTAAPDLVDVYIGDADLSGSWTAGDYLELTFDVPTNKLEKLERALRAARGEAYVADALTHATIFAAFSFEARSRGNGQEGETLYSETYRPWTLGADVSGTWVDDTTLRLVPGYVNRSHELGGDGAHLPPDPSMCGELWFGVDACSTIGSRSAPRAATATRTACASVSTSTRRRAPTTTALAAAPRGERARERRLAGRRDGRRYRGGDGFFTLITATRVRW